jgi:hypothetical protein
LRTVFDYVDPLPSTLSASRLPKELPNSVEIEYSYVYISDEEGNLEEKKNVELNVSRNFEQWISVFIDDICNMLSDVEARKYRRISVQFLYNAIRFSTLALCNELVNLKNFIAFCEAAQIIHEGQLLRERAKEKREYLLSNFLRIYVAFTFAEARIRGQYPPREGILIIKEYKHGSTPVTRKHIKK